jgi:hypothetical protein
MSPSALQNYAELRNRSFPTFVAIQSCGNRTNLRDAEYDAPLTQHSSDGSTRGSVVVALTDRHPMKFTAHTATSSVDASIFQALASVFITFSSTENISTPEENTFYDNSYLKSLFDLMSHAESPEQDYSNSSLDILGEIADGNFFDVPSSMEPELTRALDSATEGRKLSPEEWANKLIQDVRGLRDR